MTAAPSAVLRVGQARITAGLDRYARLDLDAHRSVFGPPPELTAAALVAMCERTDLRGRGGAAFPVARKLSAVMARSAGKRRPFVVVNGTEGEPGSAKDKTLLSRSPHLVLDGAMLVGRALDAAQVIVAVTSDGPQAESVSDAVAEDAELSRLVRVVLVPDRFVSGESGALISAINGKAALPPGVKTRASDAGVRAQPTLLSNTETFAQLAVLGMLGPAGYASTGVASEPGTVLLTVGGSVSRPAVVEIPAGVPLGHVLDICEAQQPGGVLIGGYHGMWLSPDAADFAPVSRSGIAASGGTLGAGVVLVLGGGSCPLGEVARVAGYMAMQSSGQCGPCKAGLPVVARSLAALAAGAGGPDQLEMARRTAAGVRGRGACHHPDGTANFVASALDVFAADVTEHMFRGTCGRPTLGILPLPDAATETRLAVDWTRCDGHGLCARIAPEMIKLDADGYPEIIDGSVPFWLAREARQAVDMCPALALTLTKPAPRPDPPQYRQRPHPRIEQPERGEPPTLTGRAMRRTEAEIEAAAAWLSEISGQRSLRA